MIKLDVNSGVYRIDMWICFDETGPVQFSAGRDSEWSIPFNNPVRPAASCKCEGAENRKLAENEET